MTDAGRNAEFIAFADDHRPLQGTLGQGVLALASWRFVATEMETAHKLAYGMPVWWVQAAMPLGFAVLGLKLGARCATAAVPKVLCGGGLTAAGWWLAHTWDGTSITFWPAAVLLVAALLAGSLPVWAQSAKLVGAQSEVAFVTKQMVKSAQRGR